MKSSQKPKRTRFKELLGWWTHEGWGLVVLWRSTGAPWPFSRTLPCGCCSDPELCPTLSNPRTAVQQAPLSSTISQSLLRFTSTESVIPSNHLILHHPFSFCLQSFPGSGSFSVNESALHIRRPQYWSFSFSISPSSGYSRLISFQIDVWVNKSQCVSAKHFRFYMRELFMCF